MPSDMQVEGSFVKDSTVMDFSTHPDVTPASPHYATCFNTASPSSSSQALVREKRMRAAVKESTARPPGDCAPFHSNDNTLIPTRVVSVSADVRLPQSDLRDPPDSQTIAEGYQPLAEGYQPDVEDQGNASDSSEESQHDDDWHHSYYTVADQYKELIAEVKGMARSSSESR